MQGSIFTKHCNLFAMYLYEHKNILDEDMPDMK